MKKNKVSPSILSADFSNLISDIQNIQNADMLHVDVMDGHFVPNISIGIPVVSSLRKKTSMFLDVHLMITDPLKYIADFANAGADLICFHVEAASDIKETIAKIRKCGKKVGLALKPATPIESVKEHITDIDMVLVMTVEPGFGGQVFMTDMLPKIKAAAKLIKSTKKDIMLQVDGGINLDTAKWAISSGADVLVAGSFIFSSQNQAELVEILQDMGR